MNARNGKNTKLVCMVIIGLLLFVYHAQALNFFQDVFSSLQESVDGNLGLNDVAQSHYDNLNNSLADTGLDMNRSKSGNALN